MSVITLTKDLSVTRRGSWLGMVAEKYPTVDSVKSARDADLLRIPLVGRASVKALRDAIRRIKNVEQ